MLKFRNLPFEDDIEKATDENNVTEDWAIIMHICDNATNYQDGAKYCFKAIMKKLHHNVPRVVVQALTLLDACVKNCDKKFLLQVASCEFTNEVKKLLPKMHPSTSLKLKELIQKWSLEEFKDDPELCIIPSFYYKLVSEGVEFPTYEKNKKDALKSSISTNPDAVNSQEEENDIIKAIEISLKETGQHKAGSTSYTNGYLSEYTEKSLPEPFKVRVLFDFEAAEDNELTIKIGEIVLVVDNSNNDWWKGTNQRGEGLFPSNFVTKDLDQVLEETTVKTNVQEKETADLIEDKEIKLDEKKIEHVLNWLNETDPTAESSDPEEMLLLERECYKMVPLIENELQIIDNRMAMLHLVNGKIMRAFETFHKLLDVNNTTLKHDNSSNNVAQTLFTQASFPTPTVWHPTIPVMAMPEGFQVLPAAEKKQNVSTFNESDNFTNSQAKHSQSTLNSQASQIQSVTSQIPQTSIARYYVPSPAMPYPLSYNSNEAIHHGFMQGASNYMTLPYSMPAVGPYLQFPHYYVNSAVPSQSRTVTVSSSSNENQSNNSQTCETKESVDAAKTQDSNTAKMSNYSEDLQNLIFNSSSSASMENPVSSIDEQKDENQPKACKADI